MYSIGQVSKILNTSVQSIQLYQKKGLIKPCYINPINGYRYYDDNNIEELYRIKMLQLASFSLNEIKNLDNINNIEKHKLINLKTKKINKDIDRLNVALKYLSTQLQGLKIVNSNKKILNEITIKKQLRRYGFVVKSNDSRSIQKHIEQVSEIKNSILRERDIYYLPCRLMKYDGSIYKLYGLLGLIDDNVKNVNTCNFIAYEGDYLSMFKKGVGNIDDDYKKILKYAKKNNYSIEDTAIEILYLDSGEVDTKDVIKEIQVKIKH